MKNAPFEENEKKSTKIQVIITHDSFSYLYNLAKGGNQSLSQPEAEHKLRAGHQQLGSQSLEETSETFVLHHVGHNTEAGLGVLKVAVLDTGLDDVQGSRDNQRSTGTANRGNEVLGPRGRVVVRQVVDVLFGESRTTEELNHC